jgi:hypothetical protein
MKLLVKVIEAKYADSPQMAVVEMTRDFLETVRKLAGKGSVSFTGELWANSSSLTDTI